MPPSILNSWKEIASYLGRSVRTAQRWEVQLAMPVRRPRGAQRGPVLALLGEIDEWLQHATRRGPHQNAIAAKLCLADNGMKQQSELLRQQLQDNLKPASQLARENQHKAAMTLSLPLEKSHKSGRRQVGH